MKTKFGLIIIFLFVGSMAFAQSSKKTNVGFYIGPNFPTLDITTPDLTATDYTGFQAGVFYRKGGLFFTQAGLEYQKLQIDLSATDSISGAVDVNRLQLPLYLGLKVLGVRAYAGPTLSYTLSTPSFNPEFGLSDFSRFGASGTVGAGIDIIIFSLDAGYTFGLTDLFAENYDGKAKYVFLNLGLKF